MAEAVLANADRAFVEEEYDSAVQLYTQALELDPNNARIYESRAHAHIKLEQYVEAVDDANKSTAISPSAKAFMRKGVACFNLEEYETAKESFEAGLQLDPSNKQLATWIRKCQAELEEEAGTAPQHTAAGSGTATSTATTSTAASPTSVLPQPPPAQQAPPAGPAAAGSDAAPSTAEPITKAAPAPFVGKYRHQWYQLQNKVTVDVFVKGLNKDQVKVSFGERELSVVITDAASGKEDYSLHVPQLYSKVKPGECRYEVLRTKIEITMVKADSVQWGSLEASDKVAAPNYSNPQAAPVAGQYPSSHVKKPKDWNKLEAEVKELEQKGELADGDPLNDFFKKIFSQGDEDQRRAMMKSFVESNGTVLSTNWSEVGAKKVECTPPDGMEVHKWSEK